MENKPSVDNTDFNALIRHISDVQEVLQRVAAHAVNLSLTARNWLIGFYIVEYEQHGEDRAQYGENLLNSLSKRLNRKGMEPRRLREFRQFYLTYSKLGVEVGKYLQRNSMFFASFGIYQKWRLPTAILEEWHTPPDRLFNRLSASHLIYLSNIKDDLKRAFL